MNVTIRNNYTNDERYYQDITQVEEVDEVTVELYSSDGSLVTTVDQEVELIII